MIDISMNYVMRKSNWVGIIWFTVFLGAFCVILNEMSITLNASLLIFTLYYDDLFLKLSLMNDFYGNFWILAKILFNDINFNFFLFKSIYYSYIPFQKSTIRSSRIDFIKNWVFLSLKTAYRHELINYL